MKVLIVGCGNMGISHALAYQSIEGCQVAGLVNRSLDPREELSEKLGGVKHFSNYQMALDEVNPDIVAICTHTIFHAEYTKMALNHNAHVFVEKPIATNMQDAREVIELANKVNKKLVVGYILRHHPSWQRFIVEAQNLGKPLVMRLNLNQQSFSKSWEFHKRILEHQSPLVDCGVHYVDVMRQITKARPIKVSAIGANLSSEIDPNMYNYGQLQVSFSDGSIGWYEAGWGPMMSDNAHFIKDVIGPNGSVSMLPHLEPGSSDDISSHTRAEALKVHTLDQKDQIIELRGEPNHLELCQLEQEYLVNAIKQDLDLTEHHLSALDSLEIVLAADLAIKENREVYFTHNQEASSSALLHANLKQY